MHESIIGVRQIDHYCTFDRTKSAVSNIIHCTRKKELEKKKKYLNYHYPKKDAI